MPRWWLALPDGDECRVLIHDTSMTIGRCYRYSSLTAAIADKASPLRLYFDARFPNIRPVQTEFRLSSGPILVDTKGANGGTLGSAFDFLVRMNLGPSHVPEVALHWFRNDPRMLAGLHGAVADAQQEAATSQGGGASERLMRACWVFALTTEVFRIRGIVPGSALATLPPNGPITADLLLELAPEVAVREMTSLQSYAVDHLYPSLPSDGALALGPTFAASRLCSADADVIVDGLLLDIKTHLGGKSKTGRRDGLSLHDTYQLLGYVLFDRPDEFGIKRVGIYSARYAHLATWDLSEFLTTLGGGPVDLAAERQKIWEFLGG